MLVGKFRASVPSFSATLAVDGDGSTLEGTAQVASIVAADENLTGHLQSPDFFDAERYPEIRFTATSIEVSGDEVTANGELTVKGTTLPIELKGEFSGPATDPYGGERIGLDLSTTFDRTKFGGDGIGPGVCGAMSGLVFSSENTVPAAGATIGCPKLKWLARLLLGCGESSCRALSTRFRS